MKVLIFTSKWIGLSLLNTLLNNQNDDEYIFIVSDPNSKEIIETLKKNKHKCMILNQSSINWINDQDEKSFDWLLNLWGSHIFSTEEISKAKRTLNIHPSFLPYGRGRDPIVWTIRYGYPAGVTLHEIVSKVDYGNILYQEEVKYDFPITGLNLYEKVIQKCIEVFDQQWPIIKNNNNRGIKQLNGEIHKTFNRKDLYIDNLLNLDEDHLSRELIIRLLSHDFGDDFSMKLQYKENRYSLRLLLKKIELEEEGNE
jgi:methionyl-tRNA formyltransferase